MIRKGSIWIAPDLPSLPYKIFSPVLMIRLLLLIVCHIYQQSIFLDFFILNIMFLGVINQRWWLLDEWLRLTIGPILWRSLVGMDCLFFYPR